MSTLRIAQIGNPLLKKKAKELSIDEIKSEKIQKLIDNMIASLDKESGVGIATPQVSSSNRIIIIHIPYVKNAYRKTNVPLTIIINPEIVKKSKNKELDWEGCLSVAKGNLRGIVPRYKRITITGLDREGNKIRFTAFSFKARVIQHEMDHLDGILFLDRMRRQDLKNLTSYKEWLKFHKDEWPKPRPL